MRHHTVPAGTSTSKSSDLPAAPEVAPRSAHSYSGEGTGRLEARNPDAAAAGLGAGQRRLRRSQSADSPASAAAGGDSLGDEVRVHNSSAAGWLAAAADYGATSTLLWSGLCVDLNQTRQDAPGRETGVR